jgi:hypothetical protein
VSPDRPLTVASPPLPLLALAVGLLVASPLSPEDEDAPVVVVLSPDAAELCDEEYAVASPVPDSATDAAALPARASSSGGAWVAAGAGVDPPADPEVVDAPVAALPAEPDPLLALPDPDVAVLEELLVEVEGPESPPRPVELDDDEPDGPEVAEPEEDELAGPEPPPLELDVTSPESPVVTSTAMPPVPPPAPPPVPPLLPPESPVVPEVPLASAPPPSPLDASLLPSDVASPVSPLSDVDSVVVVDDPDEEPDPELELDDESPLTAGSSTVRTTLDTARGGSSISAAAMAAANAIFSNMARSVLSAVTSRDGAGKWLLATVLRDVVRRAGRTLASAGQEHRDQRQQGEHGNCCVDQQGEDAGVGGLGDRLGARAVSAGGRLGRARQGRAGDRDHGDSGDPAVPAATARLGTDRLGVAATARPRRPRGDARHVGGPRGARGDTDVRCPGR